MIKLIALISHLATDDGYSFMVRKDEVFEVSDASNYERDSYRLAKPYEEIKPKAEPKTAKQKVKKVVKKPTKKKVS